MFLDFYKLREQPFGVTPDPKFLYLGAGHREALATLIYSIECNRGFSALIAPPGMGKTTLLFAVLKRFENTARTALLFHTKCNASDFFRHLVSDLGIETAGRGLLEMQQQLNRVLVTEAQNNRRVLIVIDEAQDLSDDVLESVRLLSNFETPEGKLIHFLLAGQPEFAERLARPSLAQLRQRISAIARIEPLLPAETSLYVDQRVAIAGGRGEALFNSEARALLAAASGGIPRKINMLCFNALSLGFATRQPVIDGATVREVVRDQDIESFTWQPRNRVLAAPSPINECAFASSQVADTPAPPHIAALAADGSAEPRRESFLHWVLAAAFCSASLAFSLWAMHGPASHRVVAKAHARANSSRVSQAAPQALAAAARMDHSLPTEIPRFFHRSGHRKRAIRASGLDSVSTSLDRQDNVPGLLDFRFSAAKGLFSTPQPFSARTAKQSRGLVLAPGKPLFEAPGAAGDAIGRFDQLSIGGLSDPASVFATPPMARIPNPLNFGGGAGNKSSQAVLPLNDVSIPPPKGHGELPPDVAKSGSSLVSASRPQRTDGGSNGSAR